MHFINLQKQQQLIKKDIDVAIEQVLMHGQYIMGPEVTLAEQKLAEFCGARHALTCASGTDALVMALLAKGVGPSDAVLIPSYTFAATAGAVVFAGAKPIFIDSLPHTFNMDPDSVAQGIKTAREHGLNPVGVITVDLFGQPVMYDSIIDIAEDNNLWIIADAAQSFGATYKGRKVGNIVDLSTTSFFPAKPLGCYGDGGAIFTNDDEIAAKLKSIRIHGHGVNPSEYVRVGMNGRFDTLQAAIILEKLKIFPKELVLRQQVANQYDEGLRHVVTTPQLLPETTSSWAQYTVRLPEYVDRSQLIRDLKAADIPSVVYYPKPLHKQPAYQQYLTASQTALPVCEALVDRVLSLPMSAYVSEQEIRHIVSTFCDVVESYDFTPVMAEVL